MVLENAFREKITSLIDEILKPGGITNPNLNKKVWDYFTDSDFKYGQKVGFIIGTIFGNYVAKYGKVPPEDELLEMITIVESYKDEIKKSFLDIP